MPAPDGGDDFVGIGGPGEGPRLLIVLFEEAVDRGLQVGDRSKDAGQQHDFSPLDLLLRRVAALNQGFEPTNTLAAIARRALCATRRAGLSLFEETPIGGTACDFES